MSTLHPITIAELRAALRTANRPDYLIITRPDGEPLYVRAGKIREALTATRTMGARVFVRLETGRTGLEFRWGQVGRLLLHGVPRAACGRSVRDHRGTLRWRKVVPQRAAVLHLPARAVSA